MAVPAGVHCAGPGYNSRRSVQRCDRVLDRRRQPVDVREAIQTRRTIKRYRAEPVPGALIEQVLEAAVWAPNHRLTEPWEFVVVQGETLEQLAQLRRQMVTEYLSAQRE